ncbi:hypothetical protein HYDPIDRAFT_104679 [Hydnomerulius pinastri MD-312]|nr:hypothetical protein HYDPIDRAFT_104679 [Hydnomerulius pinastri MD-312]
MDEGEDEMCTNRNHRYKHSELGWRIAIITSGSTISYAFGAVVASGVMEVMDGIFGFAGWR